MAKLTGIKSRVIGFWSSICSFTKALTWSDFNPIEERLAIETVLTSGKRVIAPIFVFVCAAMSWLFFASSNGTDRLGLFYGSAAIVLMSWSLVLSTRANWVDKAFGGFDRLHVWHRWVGIAAIVFLLLHSEAENEVSGSVFPFGRDAEDLGNSLAELAQVLLLVLITISILRILPYRIWRYSHVFIIVPFSFSAFHVVTAERPFENISAGGLWLWAWSIIGFVAFAYRIIVVDSSWFDGRATITSTSITDDVVAVSLAMPTGHKWQQILPGQFIYIRINGRWKESHPFSVSTLTSNLNQVTLHLQRTGDWTNRTADYFKTGNEVLVSRPYGHLSLQSDDMEQVWIAGGSGVTPFLQRREFFASFKNPPTLVYFYRGQASAIGLEYLRELDRELLLILREVDSSLLRARDPMHLNSVITGKQAIAACGPRNLVVSVIKRARSVESANVSFELYDYRGPYGPDLNPILKALFKLVFPIFMFNRVAWLFDESKFSEQKSDVKVNP